MMPRRATGCGGETFVVHAIHGEMEGMPAAIVETASGNVQRFPLLWLTFLDQHPLFKGEGR